MAQSSRSAYVSRWGIPSHYCYYFGKEADAGSLGDTVTAILDGARQGHRFTLLLHRCQYSVFRKMGWNGLHTGIDLYRLSILFPLRDIRRKLTALRSVSPDLLAVRGGCSTAFPGVDAAISHDELLSSIHIHATTLAGHHEDALP